MVSPAIRVLLQDKLSDRELQAEQLRKAIEAPTLLADGSVKSPYTNAVLAHFESNMGELKAHLAQVEADIAAIKAELQA